MEKAGNLVWVRGRYDFIRGCPAPLPLWTYPDPRYFHRGLFTNHLNNNANFPYFTQYLKCSKSQVKCFILNETLFFRHKMIKEKNLQTGNCRHSWRYFSVMEDMFAGDPAVLPTTVVSSMVPPRQSPAKQCPQSSSRNTEQPQSPRPAKRRFKRALEEPQWLSKYQEHSTEDARWENGFGIQKSLRPGKASCTHG